MCVSAPKWKFFWVGKWCRCFHWIELLARLPDASQAGMPAYPRQHGACFSMSSWTSIVLRDNNFNILLLDGRPFQGRYSYLWMTARGCFAHLGYQEETLSASSWANVFMVFPNLRIREFFLVNMKFGRSIRRILRIKKTAGRSEWSRIKEWIVILARLPDASQAGMPAYPRPHGACFSMSSWTPILLRYNNSKECAISFCLMGDPFRVDMVTYGWLSGGASHTSVTKRRRFQRLSGQMFISAYIPQGVVLG